MAFDNYGCVKDITAKYAPQWLSHTRKQRVDSDWWRESLEPHASLNEELDQLENDNIKVPALNRVAKKLGIDIAAAMTGWDHHCGFSHPVLDGWVVCEEHEDILMAAWAEDQEIQRQREEERREKRVLSNWTTLVRGLLIKDKLKKKFNLEVCDNAEIVTNIKRFMTEMLMHLTRRLDKKEKKPALKQEMLTDHMPVEKKKRKINRFNGMPEEEVVLRTLPDHLAPDLDIVIGNACTFLVWTEIKEGAEILKEKLREYRPKIAAFNGKGIYEIFSGSKNIYFGKQPEFIEGTNTIAFVMPSSSARCAQLPRAIDKVPFYDALRKLRDHLVGRIPQLDDAEVTFPNLELKCVKKEEPKEEAADSPVINTGCIVNVRIKVSMH
nr:hypothetical protein BaRGS_030616 [Batillaria attramentaria]